MKIRGDADHEDGSCTQTVKRVGRAHHLNGCRDTFEIHLGDTTFDLENRVIQFTTPDAKHVIGGDSVESVRMHFSHKVS
jgi:hypothetical protein